MTDFDDLSIRNVERERFDDAIRARNATREFAIAIGLIQEMTPVYVEYKSLVPYKTVEEREAEREAEDRAMTARIRERLAADPVYQAIRGK